MKAYTGVGSRSTPKHIFEMMVEAGYKLASNVKIHIHFFYRKLCIAIFLTIELVHSLLSKKLPCC